VTEVTNDAEYQTYRPVTLVEAIWTKKDTYTRPITFLHQYIKFTIASKKKRKLTG